MPFKHKTPMLQKKGISSYRALRKCKHRLTRQEIFMDSGIEDIRYGVVDSDEDPNYNVVGEVQGST